jgi:hypothetical protein
MNLRNVNASFPLGLAVLFLASVQLAATALATPLSDALAWWEPPQAQMCSSTNGPFPSKAMCEDGDMTLFNGLLCAAGDQRGCDAARLAQGPTGQWWRSPRRIGWDHNSHPNEDVSFSTDQALGVMLYIAKKRDVGAFDRWVQWIDANRPCETLVGNVCLLKGWVRFCTDDNDKRCTARPGDCAFLEAVGIFVGSRRADICKRILQDHHLPSTWLPSVPSQVVAAASANSVGFPLHLASVQLFLARAIGLRDTKLDQAASILVGRQDQNPFFAYLANGPTPQVTNQLLSLCPSKNRPSIGVNEWAWERDQLDQKWLHSMYWDCIFVGKLL